jgi:hypothetical protein
MESRKRSKRLNIIGIRNCTRYMASEAITNVDRIHKIP